MNKSVFKLFSGIAACILLFSGCSENKQKKADNPERVTLNIRMAPKTIDPQLSTTVPASQVEAMCMEGLIRQGKNPGEVYAGGAETWEMSDDGIIWTFNLRKNAEWSNGEPVTAHDYLFGFKRLLEPASAAQYSYMLYYIKNAALYNKGIIKDFSQVGIKAIGDYELQIVLEKPVPFFDQILTSPVSYPVNEKFYQSHLNNYALDKNSLLYNGPYCIAEWIPNGNYLMKKNQNYWNKDNIHIPEVNMIMVEDYNTAANMFKNGELDITATSGDQLPLFKDKDIRKVPDSVWYLQFNTESRFFKNEKIRQAVAMAINREAFCQKVRKDGSIPAYAFVPPGITGGELNGESTTFREHYGDKFFQYDPVKAKKLFQEGMDELGEIGQIHVKLTTDNSDVSRRDGQFIQQELYKNLGIDVQLDLNTFQSRIIKMDQQDYDIVLAGWLADYNDPDTFLNMWVTDGGNNHTGFSDIKYDNYVNIAESDPDNTKRMEAMHKAEKLLMGKMVIAPLYYRVTNWLVRPDIEDVVIRGVGIQTSFIWAKIKK